jgi:hypothetical protein
MWGGRGSVPPPCVMQNPVVPRAARPHSGCSQRLPPPCVMQNGLLPRALLAQPSRSQRLPPPCVMQYCVPPCADLAQPEGWGGEERAAAAQVRPLISQSGGVVTWDDSPLRPTRFRDDTKTPPP